MDAQDHKAQAAAAALELVESGMRLGLGTGSTAAKFIDLLGAKVKAGLDVVCVPTSEATRLQAERLGIPLTTLDEEPNLDLAVDGTDEVDNELRLIKGGGGALLREKIVATAADRMVIIADASKKVATLGNFPLPIEVVQWGLGSTRRLIDVIAADLGLVGNITVRRNKDGTPFITDSGNQLLDCAFGEIEDSAELAAMLTLIPGVVDHGLFIGLADMAILAGPKGLELLTFEEEDDED